MVESNGPTTVAALWAMTGISLLFMGLRFGCKSMYTRRFGIDDAILFIAWVFTLIYSALITVSVHYGTGKHGVDIHPGDEIPMYKFLFLGEFFSLIAIPTSKTSFAVTLLRLVTRRWQKWFVWFVIVSMNVVMWLCGILLFVQCRPIEKNWDQKLEGSCWRSKVQDNYSVFAGAYSAFLDVLLATFPSLIIWQVHMSTKEKLGVIVAMSFGFLAGITAAVKTYYLPGVRKYHDITFSLINLLIWSNAETAVTILAASIPFFRVLIRNATSGGQSTPFRHSYRLESYNNLENAGSWRSRPVTGTGRGTRPNNTSDMSIGEVGLPIHGRHIVKKNEITVEYHEDKILQ